MVFIFKLLNAADILPFSSSLMSHDQLFPVKIIRQIAICGIGWPDVKRDVVVKLFYQRPKGPTAFVAWY